MADPVTVIGLVSGVITFIDFGYKVVTGAKQIRDSGKGTIRELAELNTIVEDVRRLNEKIKGQIPSGQKPSGDEERVLKLVIDCESLCVQLRALMNKLAVRNSSLFETGRVAVQAILKKNDIHDLRIRLDALDTRIRASIQHLLQENHHTSIMSQLRAMEAHQQDLGVEQISKLDAVKEDIMRLTHQSEQAYYKGLQAQAATFTSLITKLGFLQNEHLATVEQVQVLESLFFPEIRRRYDQIPEAEQRTNLWVYDPTKTAFTAWLESTSHDDGLFYIFGKAGSGKSTLMKHVYEARETEKGLKKWAGAKELNISSFYFWNQGSEIQKSEIGLFQSLLYQILRTAPHFAPLITSNRLYHEVWDMKTLKKAFEFITQNSKMDYKYCFFIDGLDEYDGDESDVAQMLKTLSFSGHIKICVSSRPGRIYEGFVHEKILHNKDRMFDIAYFTKTDMKLYVHARLHGSEKFRKVAYAGVGQTKIDPLCEGIIRDITNWANGVWLWVFLVTRQIVQQVERDESTTKLRKIVDEFPADLEAYFEHIIGRIDDTHKEEMAQTFLVTMDELQPLPLYAFYLLEKERENPEYAVQEAVQSISERELMPEYEKWKSRVRNRCGDLLVVDNHPHPVFLSRSVDFLHRTVRDFLRDCYQTQLRKYLKTKFDPLVSLCRICLCFLKGLPNPDFRQRQTVNRVIGLTDELLYYAHEVEKRTPEPTPLVAILDELDRVNSHYAQHISNHWTHARDLPQNQGYDEYFEGGQCNFLALTVQARLVKYVRVKLQTAPNRLQKGGRPLLDYALRPLRATPITMPYHSARDDPSVDPNMVELLLNRGADPNQQVHLNNGETVWGLFLISMHSTREEAFDSLKKAWFRSCLMLIKAGARPDYTFVNERFVDKTVLAVMTDIFVPEEVSILETRMEACRLVQKEHSSSCWPM